MKLYAISDLHLNYRANRVALEALPAQPEDWLIVAGDIGDTLAQIRDGLALLVARFARVLFTPGNHDLFVSGAPAASAPTPHTTRPSSGRDDRLDDGPRGVARYDAIVEVCRALGVHTPEGGPLVFDGEGGPAAIALTVSLYDYTFRPAGVVLEDVIEWAATQGIRAADERLLATDPHPSIVEWSAAACAQSERLLAAAQALGHPIVLVNHWPLRRELVRLPPDVRAFAPWCGTTRSADWATTFGAAVAVSGHLHIRATDIVDGVRYEEVSLGYPRHWNGSLPLRHYLREILPGSAQFTPIPFALRIPRSKRK